MKNRRYAPHLASRTNRKQGPASTYRPRAPGYKLDAAEQTSGTRYRTQGEGAYRPSRVTAAPLGTSPRSHAQPLLAVDGLPDHTIAGIQPSGFY